MACSACSINSSLNNEYNNREIDLCELPENDVVFRDYMVSKFGKQLSTLDVKILQEEFKILRDKPGVDPMYSRTDKVRFIELSKECNALDGVSYQLAVGAIVDNEGEGIFSQYYVMYGFEDILKGKRKFSFNRFYGRVKEYTKLIGKETIGLLNKSQVENYMKHLGCTVITKNSEGYSPRGYLFPDDVAIGKTLYQIFLQNRR